MSTDLPLTIFRTSLAGTSGGDSFRGYYHLSPFFHSLPPTLLPPEVHQTWHLRKGGLPALAFSPPPHLAGLPAYHPRKNVVHNMTLMPVHQTYPPGHLLFLFVF